MAPAVKDDAPLDGLDESGTAAVFSRDALNAAYLRLVQEAKSGSHRDAQTLKLQMDDLSAMERDMRMRYRTRARMTAHGIARLKSHGLAEGPVNRGILQMVKILSDKR